MTATDSPAAPLESPPAGRRALGGRLLVVLGALCVLLLVAAVALAVLLRGYRTQDDARDDAVRAARQSAINLTSIDYEEFDVAVDRVLEGATGDFGKEFKANSGKLKDLLLTNKVKSEGKVVDAGIVRSDRSHATVLVVIDSTVRNTTTPEGRVNTNRMQLEVEKVGGRWLTSTLQFVG